MSRATASLETPSPKTTLKRVGYLLWLIDVSGAIVSVAMRVADKQKTVGILHLAVNRRYSKYFSE
jgi:hypothetical protein